MQELVETKIDGDTIHIVILEPRFQASNFAKFKELMSQCWVENISHAVIDMSAVEFIDSSGVGALMSVYRRLPESADAVTLKKMRPQVKSVIELLRVHRIFQIQD